MHCKVHCRRACSCCMSQAQDEACALRCSNCCDLVTLSARCEFNCFGLPCLLVHVSDLCLHMFLLYCALI